MLDGDRLGVYAQVVYEMVQHESWSRGQLAVDGRTQRVQVLVLILQGHLNHASPCVALFLDDSMDSVKKKDGFRESPYRSRINM